MSERVTVVFSGGGTGGHLYPALALAHALEVERPDIATFFVGAKRGIEARVLAERGLPHLLLPVEGLKRGRGWEMMRGNARAVAALARGLVEVAECLRRIRPSLVVVTGGYAGGPAGIVAVLMRIPLALQEQNSVPGLTTRALSVAAREIHVAFPEARRRLPSPARRKVRESGNPVRIAGGVGREEGARAFDLDPARPIVLVVGGSQGSLAMNDVIEGYVAGVREEGMPKGAQLLWATGPTHLDRIRDRLAKLPGGTGGLPSWLRLRGYIDDMPSALAATDLAVSRAGAMGTSEFLAWGIPSILVPLPTAAADHQTGNAAALDAAGGAMHIRQGEFTPERFEEALHALLGDPDRRALMAKTARERGRPTAANDIARSLARLLPRAAGSSDAPTRSGGGGR